MDRQERVPKFINQELELDLGDFALCLICNLEELTGIEAEHAGNQVCWKDLKFGVEVAHVAVVKAAGGLNFVFGVGKFVLQLEEILAGFEIGIIFRHSE